MLEEEKVVQLTTDQNIVARKEIGHLLLGLSQMQKDIKAGTLTEDFRDTICSLIFMYGEKIHKALNFSGKSQLEKDMDSQSIQMLNEELKSLKATLNTTNHVSTLKFGMDQACKIINQWWDELGFSFIDEINLNERGQLVVKAGFNLTHTPMFSDTPDTDRKLVLERIKRMEEEGYQLGRKQTQVFMLDTDVNRDKIIALINERFPSAKVWEKESTGYQLEGKFVLKRLNIVIKDLSEIYQTEQPAE